MSRHLCYALPLLLAALALPVRAADGDAPKVKVSWKKTVVDKKFDGEGKKLGNYDDRGEMCYFVPGKNPTQPWERHSISGPSVFSKLEIPGTRRFSHGLGHGDVNGDGRIDIICTGGWWEQPEKD